MVDARNRITGISTTNGGTALVGSTRYDEAGNLVFDGSYYYQYDAWDRLIQVNQGSWDPLNPGQFVVGALVKNYSYDGLGRLARTLSPYPAPAAAGGLNRTERFYYDGIRRIQEVVTDPIASLGFADMSGDPELKAKAGETSTGEDDKDGTPLGFEEGQVGGTSPPVPYLEREYVWGPGNGNGGVDELLVQYDAQRKPWWVVQDEGGDVVALCDLGAANADGRVVAQFTYDAYGSPLSYDNLANHPLMHCGHKGLFVDRLDGGVAAGAGGSELPRITPFAQLICHNRNRTYVPQMGRFLQADPNATAMVLLAGTAYHGRDLQGIVAAFDLLSGYQDGSNFYQYQRSNVWTHQDPMGLYSLADIAALGADVVMRGLRGGLENMVEAYGANMDDDLDWAMDWSQGDDWHSRLDNKWVAESFREGAQEGIRGALWDFVDPLGIRNWFDSSDEEPAQAGINLRQGYRAARTALRIAGPGVRFALSAARKLELAAATSAAEIARVFKRLGYTVPAHFIDRLRGVGANMHMGRMSELGLHTVDDVLEVLRKGRVVAGREAGRAYVIYRGACVVVEPATKTLITVLGEDWI